MKRTNTSATGSNATHAACKRTRRVPALLHSRAFTLIELLAVVAIMSIIMGLLVMSLRQVRGPAVQIAAGQVASGFALARQLAIAKNTEARFVIASTANGPGFPEEPFRFWTIISSNRNANNVWVMEREWERLPVGAVFLNLSATNYSGRNWGPLPADKVTNPQAIRLTNDASAADLASAWGKIQSFTTNTVNIAYPDAPSVTAATWPSGLPYVGFGRSGGLRLSGMSSRLYNPGAGADRMVGLRIVEGTSKMGTNGGEVFLESVNNARYVEAHDITGRVLVRKREDYGTQ
jgi:prepilin-type N-terminal cleavage/methylation domain-containing protein